MKKPKKSQKTSKKTGYRSDSLRGAKFAMDAALAGTLHPPAHVKLTKHELPFWKSIINNRSHQLWTASDLEIAAHLARAKCSIETLEREVAKEKVIMKSKTGRVFKNPKLDHIETLSRRVASLSRLLQVQARTVIGNPRDTKNKLDEERRITDAMPSLRKTGLIKFPNPAQ